MKKTHKLVIAATLIVAVGIVALEVFDYHPSFTIGQDVVFWSGVRHMGFGSVEGGNMIKGQFEKTTVHIFGPIRFCAVHMHG
jgi:hypothetical protein